VFIYRFMLQSINDWFFQTFSFLSSFTNWSRNNVSSDNFRLSLWSFSITVSVVIDPIIRLPLDVFSVGGRILPTRRRFSLVLQVVNCIRIVALWMEILLKVWVCREDDLCQTCATHIKLYNRCSYRYPAYKVLQSQALTLLEQWGRAAIASTNKKVLEAIFRSRLTGFLFCQFLKH